MTATERIHFVTGRLAEHALRQLLEELRPQLSFEYTIGVLPITVAALMTPAWIAKHLSPPIGTTSVLLPGYCHGDLSAVEAAARVPVRRGPRDLRQLPQFFGTSTSDDYGHHDIEIIAEINHAPRRTRAQITQLANDLRSEGADVIDLGCDPGYQWSGLPDAVRALKDHGLRVSVDSFDPQEVAAATAAGAELVLSVNRSNRDAAPDWGCEVVVIGDEPDDVQSLHESIEFLATRGVAYRIDPILEPIGCGFARSLGRYALFRDHYPEASMMMGIGNLTELTDVDSAAINVLLLAFCQELRIHSVLTTQVINWARSCVRECDIARQLVAYAVRHQTPPKHVEDRLLLLRDAKLHPLLDLDELATTVRDHNYRIYAAEGQLHAVTAGQHFYATDPFKLFAQLSSQAPVEITPSHAFYLGYELAKANIANVLGKQYEQDEALDWGFLTVPEQWQRLDKHSQRHGRKS